MKNEINRIGRFYKGIILNNIGIFMFVGILSVVFNDYGWFPNKDMYAISQLAYNVVLPVLVSFEAGRRVGGNNGGIVAALALCGIIAADMQPGLISAMMIGPVAGILWKHSMGRISAICPEPLQMLCNNLWIGILGGTLAGAAYFGIEPLMDQFAKLLSQVVNMLLSAGLIGILSVLIEPGKVFFLNNLMNHGVLIPLGMEQVAEGGRSILFLLEANPGPGLGVLLAMLLHYKDRQNEYGAAIVTHALGGLHEVYFPYVLSNLRMLFPLIAGGIAGNIIFYFGGGELQGPVSPGSLILILFMAGKSAFFPVLSGVTVSALVSFAGGMVLLRRTPRYTQEPEKINSGRHESIKEKESDEGVMKISSIAVVCDGGVGTSAMGASILRRKLAEENLLDITVNASAADRIPADVDLIVCQKDFKVHAPELFNAIHDDVKISTVETLLRTDAYKELVEELLERSR